MEASKTRTTTKPSLSKEVAHQAQSRLPRALPSPNGNASPTQPNKVVAFSRVLSTLEDDTTRDPHALPSQIGGASQSQPDEVVATSRVLPTLAKDTSRDPPRSRKVSPTSKNSVPGALPSPNGGALPTQPDDVVATSLAQSTAAVIPRAPTRSPKASPATTTSEKKRRFPFLNRSKASKSLRIASRHLGAFEFKSAVDDQLQNDLADGYVSGPYPMPPIVPCRLPMHRI